MKFLCAAISDSDECVDVATDSRAVPIYATTSYVFRNSEHASALGLAEQNIKPNTIRLSIGTEHIDDIIKDLENGFAAVAEN